MKQHGWRHLLLFYALTTKLLSSNKMLKVLTSRYFSASSCYNSLWTAQHSIIKASFHTTCIFGRVSQRAALMPEEQWHQPTKWHALSKQPSIRGIPASQLLPLHCWESQKQWAAFWTTPLTVSWQLLLWQKEKKQLWGQHAACGPCVAQACSAVSITERRGKQKKSGLIRWKTKLLI